MINYNKYGIIYIKHKRQM